MKAVHCYRPVERRSKLIHLLASMCTYEILFSVKDSAAEQGDEDVTDTRLTNTVSGVVIHVNLYQLFEQVCDT